MSENQSHHSDDTETSASPPTVTRAHQPAPRAAAIPDRIGPFKILSKIGEGGMGTVYEAEQDSPTRTVALKVIRAGLASSALLKRFALESHLLGRLQHPGIAQVYQAGTADTEMGRLPYFAMEFVRGVDVRRFVNQGGLSTRQRLELLARICDAVHHAHQKGVIHRDLKPGNILVDESGQPKILDFGVARATDADLQVTTMQTDVGQIIGTLQYMSPEQVAADPNELDTRSDVYALGVIAYEMLTGKAPYNLQHKMIHEAARIIREDEPTLLSSTSKVFRGDIETIVAKALEKEKARRYQSAAGLAGDIRRYLANEPILARPPSALYQLQKFAKRNKAFAAGLAIAMITLTAGLVTSTHLYLRAESALQGESEQRVLAELREAEAVEARKMAEQARAETEQRANELKVVTEFQQSMLSQIDAEMMGRGILEAQRGDIRSAMESRGADAAQIETALASFDDLVARTNATNLALKVVDENILVRAVTTMDQEFADQPITRAALQQTVADTYQFLGLQEPAIPLQEASLRTRRKELGAEHPATLASISAMGALLISMGKLDEAEPYYREALEGRRRTLGNDHPQTVNSITQMGSLLSQMGKNAEAEPYYREALACSRRALGDDHASTLLAINNMGALLFRIGKYAEAESLWREAVAGRRRVLGDDHPHTMISINNLAGLLLRTGKYAEAEPFYREALGGSRRKLGDNHPNTLTLINNMGALLKRMGKLADAEPYYREALEGRRRTLGNDHPSTLNTITNLASLLGGMGRYAEAEPYFREALEGSRRVLGDDHPRTLDTINSMGAFLKKTGRLAEAEPLFREVFDRCSRKPGEDHPRTRKAVKQLIALYESWHAAEPGKGYDAKAAEWRAKLPKESLKEDG